MRPYKDYLASKRAKSGRMTICQHCLGERHPQVVKAQKPLFDVAGLLQDYRQLAEQYAGTATGVRFLQLYRGLQAHSLPWQPPRTIIVSQDTLDKQL